MKFKINKLLFFDIETVSQYEDLYDMPEGLLKLWLSYYDKFRQKVTNESRIGDGMSQEDINREVYKQTASFYPEFGKVACVSMAFVLKNGKVKYESFYGEDEVEILKETRKVFDKVYGLDFDLCGQSIGYFDIPFLGKRMVIHGLVPPMIFPSHDTKPWEIRMVDTKDIWGFGNKYGLGSLDLICTMLDIDSPKNGEVKGDNVTINYWSGKHEEIKEYCERDVEALVDIVEHFNNLK